MESKALKPDVVEKLSRLSWPGNVRQLENLCRWLTVMAPGQEIQIEDLPDDLQGVQAADAGTGRRHL